MIARTVARLLALLLGCLLLAALPAHADTPVALFQTFRGNVNFTGTEETQRSKGDRSSCSVSNSNKKLSAVLKGIPTGATIKSAQLYWAGSGTKPDYTVTFDGVGVTATAKRQYVAKSGTGNLAYFGAGADVTTQVSKKGNGTYTFQDLDIENGNPWCSSGVVLGGFSLVVVYSHPDEAFRMLNLYEGFQAFQHSSLTIDLGNFSVPDPVPAKVTGRIGHVTWEGDALLSQGGESLLFNGVELTDSLNPPGNQFNSASNVTGDTSSFGIDFDVYTLTSSLIKPGQNAATTTYRSGQDLVFLGAEIVAMPYVPNSDLSLSMVRTGDLVVGNTSTYTLTVTNNGVDIETGPVTVVDTLPAGMSLVSAGGAGWSCSNVLNNGQTVVTCAQDGPVAVNAQMTPIVIVVAPTTAASYTNTATVSGKVGDSKQSNNTAADTATAVNHSASAFVFSARACADGDVMVAAESGKDKECPRFNLASVTAADTSARIYITSVKTVNGVLMASKMGDADTLAALDLAFSCLPNSPVKVAYAGKADFDCKGTSQTVNARLPAGKPTAVLESGAALAPFSYADVGRVALTLRYKGAVADAVAFVSRPADIRFTRVFRADGTDDTDETLGFTTAGAPFTMRVGALMANNLFAPSFGKEPVELKGVLPDATIALDLQLDVFLLNAKASPKAPLADIGKQDIAANAFVVEKPFTRNSTFTDYGVMDAVARWYEAGNVAATPYLLGYLGTGMVGGPPGAPKNIDVLSANRVVNATRVIGRFYPDHFVTDVTQNFACPPALNCPAVSLDPAKPSFPVSGATWSRQPFAFTVKAYGLDRGSEATELALFQNDSARPVSLSAVKAPNDTPAPVAGVLTAPVLPVSTGPASFPKLEGMASYSTGNAYSPATAASRVAGDWGAPVLFYLRASMTEAILPSGQAVISSRTPAGAWTPLYEDGLVAIAGRLFVPNVFGSDLLRLPVPLSAQYWNGSTWAAAVTDDASVVASAIRPADKGCRLAFALDRTGACKSATPLAPAGAVPVGLFHGKGMLTLQAPARGTVGSVDYTLDSPDAPWLPSTLARATFGLYKSPLIYLREVY